MELSPAELVRDRDWTLRPAFPLRVTLSDQARDTIVYYLDGSFRAVRRDFPCLNEVQGECRYHSADWSIRGAFPPLGVLALAPLALDSGPAYYETWLTPAGLETSMAAKGSVKTLSISRGYSVEDFLLDPNGTYTFHQDELAPTDVSKADSNQHFRRIAYQKRERLDLIPPWPTNPGPAAKAAPPDALLFPGERADDYGLGYTHREALEWLLHNSAEAGRIKEGGGCLVAFSNGPSFDPPAGPEPLQEERVRFVATMLETQGTGKEFQFSMRKNVVGKQFAVDQENDATWGGECAEVGRSPWPAWASSDFFAAVDRVPVSHSGRPQFSVSVKPWPTNSWGAREGWHTYAMNFRPAFVPPDASFAAFLNYQVIVNANNGWAIYMNLHPRDVVEWQRSP